MAWELQEWVKSIDIGGDGKKDGVEYNNLKEILIWDAKKLWENCQKGKITRLEYDNHLQKLRQILEKHHISVQDAYVRYNQEQKIVFQETENKSTGLSRVIRNIRTKVMVEAEQLSTEDLIQWYTNTAGNYNVRVKDFEIKLQQTSDFNTLNTKELSSYLEYLLKKGKLNKQTIEEKFGRNMIGFMRVWSNKIQESYRLNKNARSRDDITILTQAGNFLFWHEKAVEKVLDEIFRERLGQDNIQSATKIYRDAQVSKSHLFTRGGKDKQNNIDAHHEYTVLIDKAYNVFGKRKDKKEFQKSFEKLLKNGFSSYDAVFDMLGQDTEIQAFKILMAEVAKVEQKKAQDVAQTIQEHTAWKSCYAKDFCKLPPHKQKEVAEEQNDTELLQLLQELKKASKDSEHAETLSKKDVAVVTTIKNKMNGSSIDRINKAIDVTTEVDRAEAKINIAVIRMIPGFERINDIDQVWKNPKRAELLTKHLQSKSQLTKEEADILACVHLKQAQYKELDMALRNINELQYTELEKSGKIQSFIFAENLIGPIESGVTMAQLDKKLSKEIGNVVQSPTRDGTQKLGDLSSEGLSLGSAWFKHAVESLGQGQWFTALSFGSEKIRVVRNGRGFDIETHSKTEHCQKLEEVTNYIESRKFIHDIGCDFMMGNMDEILETIRKRNPKIAKTFDMKQGLTSEQEIVIMKTMIRVLDLPIVFEWVAKVELKQRFREYFTHTADSSLQKETRKWWFFSVNGGFLSEIFKNKILAFS